MDQRDFWTHVDVRPWADSPVLRHRATQNKRGLRQSSQTTVARIDGSDQANFRSLTPLDIQRSIGQSTRHPDKTSQHRLFHCRHLGETTLHQVPLRQHGISLDQRFNSVRAQCLYAKESLATARAQLFGIEAQFSEAREKSGRGHSNKCRFTL